METADVGKGAKSNQVTEKSPKNPGTHGDMTEYRAPYTRLGRCFSHFYLKI